MARSSSIRATSAIDIVEAAYRLDGSEAAWLENRSQLTRSLAQSSRTRT